MTEFLPEGSASAPAAAPLAAPTPVPQPAYNYPPPQYFAPEPVARKKVPVWVWVLIGVASLAIVGAIGAAVAFVGQQTKGFSPDYSGTEVEASDAVGSVVVSGTATVAYNKPVEWVEGADYFDTSALSTTFTKGTSLVGVHFTADPNVTTPQLVVVVEGSPEAAAYGTLEDAFNGYFKGVASTGADFEPPAPEPYSTVNGLEGYVGSFDATISGTATSNRLAVVGHGRRLVMVQWTSYSGPVDEAAMDLFLESLRVDE